MCTTCGCSTGDSQALTKNEQAAAVAIPRVVRVEQDLLTKNDHIAAHNREYLQGQEIHTFNLVSSPGAGKTTLLVETLRRMNSHSCAVIEGDQQTSRDADRIRANGGAAVQINTGKGCHLDAKMVSDAMRQLSPAPNSYLFIENVGNLVCPAAFDLGEKHRVVILSVTEGDDKPLKYPDIFANADLMVINKIDLLPYVDFDSQACINNARQINPSIQHLALSATHGAGMDEWLDWLGAE